MIALEGEEVLWRYNCEDCICTREVGEVELETVEKMKLQEVHAFQQRLFHPVLAAMLQGIHVVKENQSTLAREVQEEISRRETFITTVDGHSLNIISNPQMLALFYNDLAQPPIWTRATKGKTSHITCDVVALTKIRTLESILNPLVT